MHKAYRHAILFFSAFSLLLLFSGAWLFLEKIGLYPQDLLSYYFGDAKHFGVAKTNIGIAKTALYHLFAFGLLSMVLLHFLPFCEIRQNSSLRWLIVSVYVLGATEILSGFLVINISPFFVYLKLIAFFLYFFILLYVMYLLFKSIMYR